MKTLGAAPDPDVLDVTLRAYTALAVSLTALAVMLGVFVAGTFVLAPARQPPRRARSAVDQGLESRYPPTEAVRRLRGRTQPAVPEVLSTGRRWPRCRSHLGRGLAGHRRPAQRGRDRRHTGGAPRWDSSLALRPDRPAGPRTEEGRGPAMARGRRRGGTLEAAKLLRGAREACDRRRGRATFDYGGGGFGTAPRWHGWLVDDPPSLNCPTAGCRRSRGPPTRAPAKASLRGRPPSSVLPKR